MKVTQSMSWQMFRNFCLCILISCMKSKSWSHLPESLPSVHNVLHFQAHPPCTSFNLTLLHSTPAHQTSLPTHTVSRQTPIGSVLHTHSSSYSSVSVVPQLTHGYTMSTLSLASDPAALLELWRLNPNHPFLFVMFSICKHAAPADDSPVKVVQKDPDHRTLIGHPLLGIKRCQAFNQNL